MSESNTNKNAAMKEKRTRLIQQLKDDGVRFGVNTLNTPTLCIPEDPFQTEWPADSQRVADLVYTIYYEQNGEVLTVAEREFLLSLIRQECREGGRWFGETEAEQTERDVIVQAILCYMNTHAKFDDLTAGLVGELRVLQRSGKISQHEDIPAFTNMFTRRLRRLVPVLKGYGVVVEIYHKEDGSHTRLTRLDDFQVEPDSATTLINPPDDRNRQASGHSSGVNATMGREFRKADGDDGETRFDDPKDKDALTVRQASLAGAGGKGGAE